MTSMLSQLPQRVPETARRLNNLVWEYRMGISTRGVIEVDHPDAGHYAAMSYRSIFATLAALRLGRDDVFVDIGCGKGRVLCCAARTPMRKVVGVDLSAELCEDARCNAARARGLKTPIEVHCALADDFDYSEGTVFFLFSPFGAETMRRVLAKIHADRGSGDVRIAYANPAYPEPFAEQAWLERYEFWDRLERNDEHSVAFYRSAT